MVYSYWISFCSCRFNQLNMSVEYLRGLVDMSKHEIYIFFVYVFILYVHLVVIYVTFAFSSCKPGVSYICQENKFHFPGSMDIDSDSLS